MADATKTESERIVRIWDSPLARIHYLETMLSNKEWEAVIYQPEFKPDGSYVTDAPKILSELKQNMEQRGYSATLGTDEGIPVLRVKNFGPEMNVAKALEELGVVKGVAYSFTHFDQSFGKIIKDTVNYFKTIARDKARFVGGVYIVGDLLLALAARFQGKDSVEVPVKENKFKDALFASAGIMAVAQSLTYLGFAKDQNVEAYNKLEKKANQLLEKGDLLDDNTWRFKADELPKAKGPLKLLKKNPIQVGALFQVAGQVGLIASAIIGLRQYKPFAGGKPSMREMLASMKMKDGGTIGDRNQTESKAISKLVGSGMDILTGILSTVSWGLMTKTTPNQYAKEELASWTNPTRWWQEVMQAPNKLASALAFCATTTGAAAGMAKGNKMQLAANGAYIGGDLALGMIDNDSYGEGKGGKSEMADTLVESAKKILEGLPVVLGQEEQAQLVSNMAHYMAAKSLHEKAYGNKGHAPSEEEIDKLALLVRDGLNEALPQHPGLEKLAEAIAGFAGRFDETQSAAVRKELSKKIAGLPSVYVEADELMDAVGRQPAVSASGQNPENVGQMRKELAGLLKTVPMGVQPAIADAIYDVAGKFLPQLDAQQRQETSDYVFDKAFNDIAAHLEKEMGKEQGGIPEKGGSHLQQQMQRRMQSREGHMVSGPP